MEYQNTALKEKNYKANNRSKQWTLKRKNRQK